MEGTGRQIFRKKALDRMSSPERLHELMPLVGRLDWLALLTLLLVLGSAVLWSINARLPLSVNGKGVFIRPRRIVQLQSAVDGRIVALNVAPGDDVREGMSIGSLDQGEVRKRLEQSRLLRQQLLSQEQVRGGLETAEVNLFRQRAEQERKSIGAQRENLVQSRKALDSMAPMLAERVKSLKSLQEAKLLAGVSPELIEAERASLDNATRVTEIESKLQQLEAQEKDLDQQQGKLRQTQTESGISRVNSIQQVSTQIALDEVALRRSGQLLSEYTGKVVELVARPGQFVTAGSRLATIELSESKPGQLECVMYLPVRNGKRLRSGMEVQVTPDVVERERYGGIIGKVTSVSPYPVTAEGAASLIGSSEIARSLTGDEPCLEVTATLDTDGRTPSGYRWSSSQGPPMKMTAGTTTSARVVIEREPAIVYLMPFLRSLSGIR